MGPQALHSRRTARLREEKGDRARRSALDHEALVWVLSALSQVFRIPFDPKLVLGSFHRRTI